MSVVTRMADSLLARVAPKMTASAQTYTECSCNPFPWNPHCGILNERVCRTCGESWCGSWRFVSCGC